MTISTPVIEETRVLKAGTAAADTAADYLRGGGLVAFPTETVYGLGADATNGTAVARIYAAKGRPSFNPLIAHVADLITARDLAIFNADALKLAEAFWPGPLTLVLPRREDCRVSDLATAGLETIALRVPDHPAAAEILRAFGGPVVAPSANLSGHISPTTAQHVAADLTGRIEMIVDGGATRVGVESTIVACTDRPILLRPGGIPRQAIEDKLGHAIDTAQGESSGEDAPLAPGMLASHYAPKAQVRLNATSLRPGEALLAFGEAFAGADAATAMLNLSESADLTEAAANLFAHLRRLDASGAAQIAVMPIPASGLGEAINDRLRRAAAPRSST